MTNVITRYFDDRTRARAVSHELVQRQRLSPKIVSLFDKADGLVETLTEDGVEEATARAYQERLANGGAVILVLAGYKPLGVAQITRDTMARMGASDMGGLTEEVWIKDRSRPNLSILDDHPHFLLRPRDPNSTTYHMADWPIPLISRRKPYDGMVIPRHGHMAAEPIPLLYKDWMGEEYKPYTKSIFGRHARMANWPIGLLAPHDRRYGRFPFGLLVPGNRFMAKFPFGHIVPGHKHYAKWPIGLLVPRGRRKMANWPFPHLINGKTHTNSLVPGNRFMANFPFAHIVPGHKHYASRPIGHLVSHNRRYGRFPFGLLVPGQKYMAKFPFGHIVPGHKHYAKWPFGHLVPGHKFMANWIWPHTKTEAS
jgi:hypothetical protein